MRTRSRLSVSVALILSLALAVGGCLGNQPVGITDTGPVGLPAYGVINTQQAAEVIVALHDDPEFVLLDIRTPAEVDAGHISGATELDYYSASFRDDLDEFDRALVYLIYCRTGNRTRQAMSIMDELGFEHVYDMGGGISQWTAAGYPICVGSLDAEHSCSGELPQVSQ